MIDANDKDTSTQDDDGKREFDVTSTVDHQPHGNDKHGYNDYDDEDENYTYDDTFYQRHIELPAKRFLFDLDDEQQDNLRQLLIHLASATDDMPRWTLGPWAKVLQDLDKWNLETQDDYQFSEHLRYMHQSVEMMFLRCMRQRMFELYCAADFFYYEADCKRFHTAAKCEEKDDLSNVERTNINERRKPHPGKFKRGWHSIY